MKCDNQHCQAETEAAIDMIEWQARPEINRKLDGEGDVQSMIDGRGQYDGGMPRRHKHTRARREGPLMFGRQSA
jgi:hypothetical protein